MPNALAFSSRDVPIVGQPGVLKGGWATVLWQCNCETKEPMLLQANLPAFCPSCKRGYAIIAFALNAQGQIQAEIGIVQQRRADA